MGLEDSVKSEIEQVISGNQVVLFMKGTRHFPQCGFSATVTQILDELVSEYHTVNVLKEPEIRQGIKDFSSWPTIPQLYVGGKFIGGCDIVREMYIAGELQQVLGVEDTAKEPSVIVTAAAKAAFQAATQDEPGMLRLAVSTRFEYELAVDQPKPGDYQVDAGGITVLVDRMSAKRADGITIDFSDEQGGGFKLDNPNEPARVQTLTPAELKAKLDAGEPLELIDVRTEEEYATARIEGGELLDKAAPRLADLAKDTPLVFYCHHGMRSAQAAERFLREGFTEVYNLTGGIDRWSQDVDSSVPRYQ
ncbi:MAG: Grx4 family monothiol glutaredoxin [Myxococcales bacterium]|nr:Grx4 family monothiol glutaredoxin [Myxococcales bacterium]